MQQTECTGANILDAGGVILISGVADAQSITGDLIMLYTLMPLIGTGT